tara:strand:+ start:250 stop:1239 length:990 start_codon:yes stop_codon:yes gene_type:complete
MIDETQAREVREQTRALTAQIERRIVGHQNLVRGVLACLLADGHVLLEGVPGLGKTLLVKTLGDALELEFARIQCTPDLMPADIIGTQMVVEDERGGRVFEFRPGPVFTQLLLADEVNRATPKTQSALLEAMEEKAVTVGRERHSLASPFMVLATQNPIEMEGTYPLPEAQLDRFLLKLAADYPSAEELSRIVEIATGTAPPEVEHTMSLEVLRTTRELVRQVVVADHVKDYAVRLVLATHPGGDTAPEGIRRYVRHGSSPRGVLAMVLAAKAFAAMDGRLNVSFDDLNEAALPALRHRILLNFEGEADAVGTDALVRELIDSVPVGER